MADLDDRSEALPEGWGERLFALFTRPLDLFISLDRRPEWAIPILILVMVALVHLAITVPQIVAPEYLDRLERRGILSEEQMELARSQIEPSRLLPRAMVGLVFGMLIGLFVSSGITHWAFQLAGGDAPFLKTLSVFSYTSLVHLPGIAIRTLLMWVKRSSCVYTSLALLWPRAEEASRTFRLLSSIDLFTVWRLVLISIGMAVIFRFGTRRSLCILFGLWAVTVALRVYLGDLVGMIHTP